jgi:two-component sensor histidine kinase
MLIDGAPITVTPRVALTLALVTHELTTNAAKYGALSVPAGRIEVGWRTVSTPGKPLALRVEWQERNGRAVVAPKRRGFGTRFIEGSVKAELQGAAKLEFGADGLRCTMEFPLEYAAVELDGMGG